MRILSKLTLTIFLLIPVYSYSDVIPSPVITTIPVTPFETDLVTVNVPYNDCSLTGGNRLNIDKLEVNNFTIEVDASFLGALCLSAGDAPAWHEFPINIGKLSPGQYSVQYTYNEFNNTNFYSYSFRVNSAITVPVNNFWFMLSLIILLTFTSKLFLKRT